MADRLYPTKTRLALLDQMDNGQVLTDITVDHDLILLFPYAPTQWQDRTAVTAKAREMEAAGWCEEREGGIDWQPTAYGRAIRAVRVFDRDDGKHIVAETGDPDEPRHLGDAKTIKPGRQWLITVGRHAAARDRVHEAREELRHMAATALAADPAFTVQEGPS